MGLKRIAFVWGFAEATLFFIVPDVFLTIAGRNKIPKGIIACFIALLGALLGGTLMYAWGHFHPESAFQTLEKTPGINQLLIEKAQVELETLGAKAILLAPLKGIPYKIFAVLAGRQGIPFALFALITIPARLIRFLIVTVLCHYALKLVLGKKTAQTKLLALGLGWIIFYIAYFIKMGW